MTTSSIIPDQQQRQRALATDTSFIVQAPAGSGKTELLTQRFLALLAEVEKAPEEIIAITFTRKAAAEMQARILAALRKAQDQEKPQAAHALQTWQLAQRVLARNTECQWQLLNNPNRLRIQTIDSLCASLVRRMPLLAHFGVAPQIIENASELYQRAVRMVLQGLDNAEPWADSLEALLLHLDNDQNKVEQLLINMLARREQWLPHILGCNAREVLELALQHIVTTAMQNVHACFPFEFVDELLVLLDFSLGNMDGSVVAFAPHPNPLPGVPGRGDSMPVAAGRGNFLSKLPGSEINDLVRWQQIISLLLTKDGTWRKKVDKRLGFPPASAAANVVEKQQLTDMKQRIEVLLSRLTEYETLRCALAELADAPPPFYNEQQWCIVEALVNLLPTLVAALQLEFQERGQVDHAEILLKALQSLGEVDAPTDLALILDYQIRHLLIDEFQDTSASQFRLLQLLTANWDNHCGRTLFLVGDPMQSIYRFRKAEVGIFLRAWNEGVGNITLQTLLLTSNFRSEAGIVNWINQNFKNLLPSKNDITTSAVAYQLATPINNLNKDTAVQIHPIIDMDNEAEAQTVVDIIKTTQANYPDASIAILVMARSHLAAIIPELQRQNLAFRAVEIENLFQRMIIQDLYALTCALLHPADRLAWLSILRAPWCGLTLADLHVLVQSQANQLIWDQLQQFETLALSPSTGERIKRFVSIINTALKQRRRSSLRAWIESVWLALGGPACLTQALDLENAQAFFNLLEQYDRGGEIADMTVFAKQLQNLTAHANQDATTKLEIMTIHKAKGLEFDCVILPGLQRAARRDDQQLLLWGEQQQDSGETDLMIAPIKATGTQTDAIYDYLRRLESKKAYNEAGRLLYVAATRAKQTLHLIAQAHTDEKNLDVVKKPSNGSLLEQLWPQVENAFTAAKAALTSSHSSIITTEKKSTSMPHLLHRLKNSWRNPLLQADLKTANIQQFNSLNNAALISDDSSQDSTAALQIIGTVTHYFLQHLSQLDISQLTGDWLTSQQTLLQQLLVNHGIAPADLALGISTMNGALQNILQDKRGRWILDHNHQEARSEFAVTAVLNNELVHLVIDRTFVVDGTRWIIDYKVADYRGTDLPEFLSEQQRLYLPQLQQYAAAMRMLDARPIRLGLYFPLICAWCEITGQPLDSSP